MKVNLQRKNDTAVVFISHDPRVQAMCDRAGVLSKEAFTLMEVDAFSGYAEGLRQ